MEKKEALAYKNFVIEAEKAFKLIVSKKELLDSKELKKYKRIYDPDEFEYAYSSFEQELKTNCLNYNNFNFIQSFLKNIFSEACESVLPNSTIINYIIENDFQVEFLLKLYGNIKKEKETFKFLCELETGIHNKTLYNYYLELLKDEEVNEANNDDITPDPRFDFNQLKSEIETGGSSPMEKVKIAHQRLYDFLQWQKEYDILDEWALGNKSKYEITGKLYPKFEELCNLEISRLEKLAAMDENTSTAKHASKQGIIKIASKRKTDFIKILSAMYDTKMFVNADGNPVTNKQRLMEAFGEFLNDDFGAYSTLLSQAKENNRDKYMDPFEKIKKAANHYFFDEK